MGWGNFNPMMLMQGAMMAAQGGQGNMMGGQGGMMGGMMDPSAMMGVSQLLERHQTLTDLFQSNPYR